MADVINSTAIKPGMCFKWEGELYRCIKTDRNKTAMAKMKLKVKVRAPRTGVVKDLSFLGSDSVEVAYIDKREMQYLYDDGEAYVFMDNATYEQISIAHDVLEWESQFLTDNMIVNIQVFEGSEILGIILPDKVALEIVECEPAVKGNTATSASKLAKCSTGLEIRVPLFIEEGEMVLVNTEDGEYSSRA